ncbi:hypothetical protein [Nocardia bovistercoris]|uniref:Uncharacterized protein n=1 Tax=Nocardia bovistercoris TaxID=2785916 RepID=A0A931IBS8_9NOCA|nr:hypothetical protein [Nocardia bovistercoris]MBH0777287.1 hypothetical protein [Nocardia bovistercoris]
MGLLDRWTGMRSLDMGGITYSFRTVTVFSFRKSRRSSILYRTRRDVRQTGHRSILLQSLIDNRSVLSDIPGSAIARQYKTEMRILRNLQASDGSGQIIFLMCQFIPRVIAGVAVAVLASMQNFNIEARVGVMMGVVIGVAAGVVAPGLSSILGARSVLILLPLIAGVATIPLLYGKSLESLSVTAHVSLLTILCLMTASLAISGLFVYSGLLIGLLIGLRRKNSHRRKIDPSMLIVNSLLDLIMLLRSAQALISEDGKWQVVSRLHESSAYIRTYLPVTGSILDPVERIVFEGRCHSASKIIRSYALWAALPTPSTRHDLLERLEEVTTNISLGLYDLMPKSEGVAVISVADRLRAMVRVLLNIMAGTIPLMLIYLAKWAGFDLSASGIGVGAAVFAILWAAVVIISSLDENYASRLAALSDMMSAIRGSAKSESAPGVVGGGQTGRN